MTRPIVFMSDYGLQDEYVGVCHGVIAGIAPDARIIDLAHQLPPLEVLRGAVTLAESVPFMPEDAVYLAIVDPGVGTSRPALAVETVQGPVLVGPDNGLLSMAWEALGGVSRAVEITSERFMLQPVSRTFHGRDVFAPAAAHLANGSAKLDDLGSPVEVRRLEVVSLPEPVVDDGQIECEVIGVDRYGNLQLNVTHKHYSASGLGPAVSVRGHPIPIVAAFADAPGQQLAALWDSRGWLALIVTAGSAAKVLGLHAGDRLLLESA